MPLLELLFLGLLLATAFAALEARDLLGSLILFGAFSFFAAVFYALVGALDVAFTEAVLGSVFATVFFIAVLRVSGRQTRPQESRPWVRRLALAAALGALGLLVGASTGLPPFGAADTPAARGPAERYIGQGPRETGAKNMVTGIIVDYRAFDTLGETAVILAAGLACLLILAPVRREEDAP